MQVFFPSLSCSLYLLNHCHVLLSNGVITLMAESFPTYCDRDLTIGMVRMIIIMMMTMMMGRVTVAMVMMEMTMMMMMMIIR